jgi:hypothetical protein
MLDAGVPIGSNIKALMEEIHSYWIGFWTAKGEIWRIPILACMVQAGQMQ